MVERLKLETPVQLFPTVQEAFQAVGCGCSRAVLPIESHGGGYVQPVLDLLLNGSQVIVDEGLMPDAAAGPDCQVRFIGVAPAAPAVIPGRVYKTSLVIIEGVDRPGMLSHILNAFATRSINLVSIMSRPTRGQLGRYHFFIDIEGHPDSPPIQAALAEVRLENEIKLLGSYPKAVALQCHSRAAALRPASDFFPYNPGRPSVVVTGGAGAYANARRALAAFDLRGVAGRRVLLKPNAGRVAGPASGVVTNPEVVAAAIDAFREAGAEVAIGESPITGVRTMEAFEASGIAGMARDRHCPLLDMDQRPPVETAIPDGQAVHVIKVCTEVFEYDVVVSIPVMKMHMHTGVTLGVKNMKGCLWRRSKVRLHMLPDVPGATEKSLDIAIVDLSSVLRPHFTLIDGTTGMEGLGPSAGQPKALNVVVAGVDVFATDAVACELMGVPASQVPHLRLGAARGHGVIDLVDIDVTPADWRRWAQPFVPSPAHLSLSFPDVTVLDRNSCSACQSTVLLFLQRHRKELFDYFPAGEPVRMALGKGHDDLPEGTLCIGNCTAAHKARGLFIGGCPPVASAILRSLGRHNDAAEDEDREY